MTIHKAEAPRQNQGANHSLRANGESNSTVRAILHKPAIDISDSDYPLGAAFAFSRDRIIGCRAAVLEAATIKRLSVGAAVQLTGHFEKREDSKGKRVRCFIVKKVMQ